MEVYFMFGLTPFRRNQSVGRSRDFWDFDRFFEDFFNDSVFPAFYNSRHMKVDIKENENEYVVEAELPGVKKEEISIDLHDDRLTIAVKRDEQVNEEQENYIRKERRSCSMCRSFYVENVKNENVSAKLENGLLTIVLPKKEPGKPNSRKIQID